MGAFGTRSNPKKELSLPLKNKVTFIRSLLTFSLAIAYLCNLFIRSAVLDHLVLAMLTAAILMSFAVVTGSSRLIGYGTFIISIVLFFLSEAPLSQWAAALKENLDMVVMFILVPLIGIPIQYGGYFSALQNVFLRYIKTSSQFYLLVSSVSAFLGVLINLATIPLVYQISKASSISSNKKLLSSAMSRGFATVSIWAPTTAAIALIMRLTGSEWTVFFPFGLACGAICWLTGYIMTHLEERKTVPAAPEAASEVSKEDVRKVIELSGFGVALVVFITLISHFAGIPTILVVSIASLVYPLVWMAMIGKLPVLFTKFYSDYFSTSLPRLKNEIVLFMGAGFFVCSITYSQLGNYVPQLLSRLVGHNVFLLTLIVIFGNLLLSGAGVHPIIPVMIIGGTVHPEAYGMSPTYLALLLSVSWSTGITISPTSATVIATAGLTGESPLQVGYRWNSVYILATALSITAFLTIVHELGLV